MPELLQPCQTLPAILIVAGHVEPVVASLIETRKRILATKPQSFGFVSYGLLMGLLDTAHQAGAAVGIWVPGFMYDLHGTYQWGLVFFLGCFALSLVLLGMVQPVRPVRRPVSLPTPVPNPQ